MNDNLKQHFRDSEAPFIEQVTGWLRQVADQYRPILTAFLNPRQIYIAQTLVNQLDDVRMRASGGFEGAELQRILFTRCITNLKWPIFKSHCLTLFIP
ncbi:putative RNA-binding protein YlmH [Lactiplantibacillus plantarum subsp. plantarum]|uniref:Putative RNA-binding protein YlmH n=1 Tax=Lactiplantibacillus plantarum subsp. plantarum TaxID=337330 RepID=A0A2S3U1X3_LACPN|nr:putative RNA-binding protein YlmH [Lactiplantibacillus plantarum subsp. plantarum]